MHPILIDLGPFPLRSFGLMVVLGFLLGAHWFTKLGLRASSTPEGTREKLDSVPMWVLGGVIGGARLMYVIVEVLRDSSIGQSFVADPLKIFFVWEGGLVMYGGAFGGMLGGWWASRKHQLDPKQVLDLGVVVAFMGLAVGRIGCLLVGDDYGSVVPEAYKDLPFPITITVPEELKEGSLFGDDNRGKVLWATQIWMSVNAACIAALGFFLLRRRRFRGQVALQLMFVYSIMRYVIEAFRGDELRGVWFGGLSTSQLVSIVTGVICLALLVVLRGRADEDVTTITTSPPEGAGA